MLKKSFLKWILASSAVSLAQVQFCISHRLTCVSEMDLAWTDHRLLKSIIFIPVLCIQFINTDALCTLWALCRQKRVRFGFCLFVFKNLLIQIVLFPEMYLYCTWKKLRWEGAGWHILNCYILQNRLPVVSVCTLQKYGFNFTFEIWVEQCCQHIFFPVKTFHLFLSL